MLPSGGLDPRPISFPQSAKSGWLSCAYRVTFLCQDVTLKRDLDHCAVLGLGLK
jgi:hypothetical protein